MQWKTVIAGTVLISLLLIAALAMLSWTARKPKVIGVRDGRLPSCPDSPNCVSTQAERESQLMNPIAFENDAMTALKLLKTVISEMPRARIMAVGDHYLHAEFTSLLFRFTDDVEFFVDSDNGVIHFRSASRAGYSDFGINRRRMQAIVTAFQREAAHHERGPKTER